MSSNSSDRALDASATPARRADDLRAGAFFAVLAAACFAVMSACVKAASAHAGTELIVFFRSGVSLLLLLPWLLRRGLGVLATRRPGAHLWRAAFGTCAIFSFFYAIAHLHLAEAILLTYSTPLFIPFIAWAMLREPPPPVIFGAIALGFAGIALIAKPGAGHPLSLATWVGVLSAVCAASALVGIRRMSDTEPAPRIVFYFSALSTLVAAVPAALAWQTPDAPQLALLLGVGVFATAGQLSLTHAYGLAPAARIGAFTYSSVVFGGLIAWAVWGDVPDATSMAGMALVFACCMLAGWRPAPRTARAAA